MVDRKSGYQQHTQHDSSSESCDEGSSSSLDLTLSSGDAPHTGTTTGSSEAKRQRQEIQQLIEKETRYVNAWRALVAAIMVIIGTGACVLTFLFLSNEEERAFYNGVSNTGSFPIVIMFASSFSDTFATLPQFQDIAMSVKLAMEHRMLSVDASFDGLHRVMSSFGHGTWPLATVPDFHDHSEHLRRVTGAIAVWWAPLLSLAEKPAWELHVQTFPHATEIYPKIYQINNRTFEESPETRLFLSPVAQMDPPSQDLQVVHSPVNYDLLSDDFEADMIRKAGGDYHQMVLSDFAEMDLFRKALGHDENDPASLVVVPIFREADSTGGTVGSLQGMISWATLFSGILTDESEAIYCVLKSECVLESTSKYFTYYISGPNVTLLGEGDLYGDEYESQEVAVELKLESQKGEHGPVGCHYSAYLYPGREMHDFYLTRKPAMFASIAAAVFFLMAFAFVAFAMFVQRRNDKVIAAAARTNAIVAQMFPGTVRDRLLAPQEEKGKSGRVAAPKTGLKNFLDDGNSEGPINMIQNSQPLADLFPEATIMFADLVGFTAWSKSFF